MPTFPLPESPSAAPYGSAYHVPVMVGPVLDFLRPERGGVFLDGTLGGAGHAEALLERGPDARLLATDRDPEALAQAELRLARFGGRFRLARGNFAEAATLFELAPGSLDGALLDLGVSSHQLNADRRGFTFRPGAALDMRLSGGAEGELSAADLLAEASEDELATLFRTYAEEPRARRLARQLIAMRDEAPLVTSEQLVEAVNRVIPRAETADRARIFQALRIAVNGELEALAGALPGLRELLRGGAVLVVMSYHSLEDRLVKESFREWSAACVCPPRFPVCQCRGRPLGETLTRKPLGPSPDELALNPRARSVRVRAWKRA